MKKFTLLFLFIPFLSHTQTVVTLDLNQPPEFGFEIGLHDTTIIKGESVTIANDLIVYGGSGEYSFIWSPGKSLNDSTIMNPVASPEDTTNYTLTVSDKFGCSFSINYLVNVKMYPTNIPAVYEQNSKLMARLFPNPNNGLFKVELSGEPQDMIQLTIIDHAGRTVKRQTVKNFDGEHIEEMNMFLPKGIYTLLISSEISKIQRQFIIK